MKRKSVKKPDIPTVYCMRLWSIIIRAPGECSMRGRDHVYCSGPLQGMHLIGRSANWDTRYSLLNGLPGCAAHHRYYTDREHEWNRMLDVCFTSRMEALHAIPRLIKRDYWKLALELEEEIRRLVRMKEMKHFYSERDAKLIDEICGKENP